MGFKVKSKRFRIVAWKIWDFPKLYITFSSKTRVFFGQMTRFSRQIFIFPGQTALFSSQIVHFPDRITLFSGRMVIFPSGKRTFPASAASAEHSADIIPPEIARMRAVISSIRIEKKASVFCRDRSFVISMFMFRVN
jgi:hypothetical protein